MYQVPRSNIRGTFLVVVIANTAFIQYTYDKGNLSSVQRTTRMASVTSGGQRYGYTYDSMGNIATFSAPGKGTVTYTYDNQGQLLKAAGDTTYTYTYDGAGNILTASDGTATHSYTYGDTNWKDLLTAFDGNSISYDAIGNPTSYFNGTRWNFTWVNGRSLATASDGTNSLSFAYDAGGLRTSKTVNGVSYRYYYASGRLMRMTWGTNTIDFFYDANGTPYAMKYNGTAYYYITNLQGDVMRIVDGSQNTVTSYDYDPYGKVISATGTLANINPLRYRGYVYDQETGFYYLQSRYYDPTIGRFINADSYATTGQGIIGHNMFAYCKNNPVINIDLFGNRTFSISLGLNAVFFLGISINISLAWDDTGGFDIQWNYSCPGVNNTATLGIIGVGVGATIQVTNAKKVDDLLGNSYAQGVSIGAVPYLGVDLVSNSSMSSSESKIDGFQIVIGIGAGVDMHASQSYTSSLLSDANKRISSGTLSSLERRRKYARAKVERIVMQALLS